jgi:hypothetical protein
MTMALYVFMADAIHVAGQGVDVIRNMLPADFNWPLFGLALAFMSSPVIYELHSRWPRREFAPGTLEAR